MVYHVDSWRIASRGNHQEILGFLTTAVAEKKGSLAVEMLGALSEKDLRDAKMAVLLDHLRNTPVTDVPNFVSCVLNPRIYLEELTPYKSFFKGAIAEADAKTFAAEPQKLVEWCQKNITVNDSINSQRILMSPEGVWRARVADSRSLEIFFIAMARSLGIPAWIDQVTGTVRYMDSKATTYDVDFASSTTDSAVMEPEIEAKSALFTKSKDSYEVGDIVQYFDGEYNPVRRVTEVSADGQTYTVVGDNEPSSDAVEVKAEDISGAVFWSSTFLYGFIDFYVTALGAAVTVLLSFIMLMMSDFLMFRKRKAELMAKREAQEKKEALKLKVRQGVEDPEAQAQEDLSPIEKRKAEKQAKLEKERAEIAAEMKQLQKKMKAEEAELQQKESGKRGKKK